MTDAERIAKLEEQVANLTDLLQTMVKHFMDYSIDVDDWDRKKAHEYCGYYDNPEEKLVKGYAKGLRCYMKKALENN